MQLVFNSNADQQDIVNHTLFLLGRITTSEYPLKDIARNVNAGLSIIWQAIFEAYGGWKFMDDGQSDTSTGVPYADQTITSGTGLYSIPSASLVIDGMIFRTAASQPYQQLKPLTHEEFMAMGADAMFPSTGMPIYYLLQGDIIRLLPIPNFTLASTGLRVFFQKDMTAFASTATTATPGFASPFHEACAVYAALVYAKAYMPDRVSQLSADWVYYVGDPGKKLTGAIQAFYAKRYAERWPKGIPAGRDLVEEYS